MRRATGLLFAILTGLVCFAPAAPAQNSATTLEITARLTPTAARPEPVRQFTFYILTRSYVDITKEAEATDALPPRDEFIDGLKVSKQLKTWLKAHDILDLTKPDVDSLLTPDDIMDVPEFLLAYQHANSGGITHGIPTPKYNESDKVDHPAKYEKERQAYLDALKKFIIANRMTISGVELELDAINPQRKWALLESNRKNRVQRIAPEVAQTKYMVAKVDTDLEGHAQIRGLAPGNYWISSLNLDANAGDARARWDVPVTIQAGQNVHIDLTNLNATDTLAASAP